MKPLAMQRRQQRFRQGFLAIWVPAALLFFVSSAPAQEDGLQEGDRVLAAAGGPNYTSTKFIARCSPGQHLVGFDVQSGNWDLVSIQPICATALAPAVAGPFESYPSKLGGNRVYTDEEAALIRWQLTGQAPPPAPTPLPPDQVRAEAPDGRAGPAGTRLVCPRDVPVVTKMVVELERTKKDWFGFGPSVSGIGLYCGLVGRPQSRHVPGPTYFGTDRMDETRGNSTCPEPLVAVGISGQAAVRLDSLGLICGEPTLAQGAPVRAQGRVKVSAEAVADRRPLSICDSARAARARNSPAAPGLEAQCKVQGEQPAIDFDGLAIKGEAIASQDPLSVDLRNQQPEGPIRLGFDIGMGVAEGQTAPGPGKKAIQDRLSPAEQSGFVFALAFSLDRNRNPELARIGAAVAAADPDTAAARAAQPDVLHRLGFDIATGLFGNPALGAKGNTSMGPGSTEIRNALAASALNGFDDAVKFHQRQSYAH